MVVSEFGQKKHEDIPRIICREILCEDTVERVTALGTREKSSVPSESRFFPRVEPSP